MVVDLVGRSGNDFDKRPDVTNKVQGAASPDKNFRFVCSRSGFGTKEPRTPYYFSTFTSGTVSWSLWLARRRPNSNQKTWDDGTLRRPDERI